MTGNHGGPLLRHRPIMSVMAALAMASLMISSTAVAHSDELIGNQDHGEARAEMLRDIEQARLRALVEADIPKARKLHAHDFQLINPGGMALSDEEYLAFIATGAVDYLVFEPVSPIEVRTDGASGVLRYRSKIEVIVFGERQSLNAWHTDLYELRRGKWKVVWSQATAIQ
jgi:hypothetical protein